MAPCVKDEAQKVQQDLRRENGGAARLIIIWGHLDEIDPDDLMGAGHFLQHLEHIVIKKSTMAGGAGSRRDGGAERIDIDRHINLIFQHK